MTLEYLPGEDVDLDALNEDIVIDSDVEIETALLIIQSVDEKLAWYKKIKKHRAEILDSEVSKWGVVRDRLRAAVQEAMLRIAPKKKTLEFPGTGRATRSKKSGLWVVNDPTALAKFLEDQNMTDGVLTREPKFDKKALDKKLDSLHEKKIDIPGAEFKDGDVSLTISFSSKGAKKESPKLKVATEKVAPTPQPATPVAPAPVPDTGNISITDV